MAAPVSVVIPCYCCSDTIQRAVESVVNQTLPPREIILVNDHSPDQSLASLRNLQNQYGADFVRLINLEENVGPGEARNQGWAKATQDYIAFLDADDAWHPQKLEIQFKILMGNPQIQVLGAIPPPVNAKDKENSILEDEFEVFSIGKNQILRTNPLETSSVILTRRVSPRFAANKRYCEDHFLWATLCLDEYKCFLIGNPVTYIYKSFGTGGLTRNLLKMRLGYLQNCWDFYKVRKISLCSFCFLSFYSILKFFVAFLVTPARLSRFKSHYLQYSK
ncbi:MAG: glycosyltransferase family 2 protein, partial [Cyanobacteriota bacterium]